MQPSFQIVRPQDVTARERQYIEAALRWVSVSRRIEISAAKVLDLATANQAQIWRLEGKATHCVIVTQLISWPYGRELFIYLVGGQGALRHSAYIIRRLEDYGRKKGCEWIRATARNEMARFLIRHGGFKPALTTVTKHLSNDTAAP